MAGSTPRIGLSSSLPPALRRLEFDGRVQRAPRAMRALFVDGLLAGMWEVDAAFGAVAWSPFGTVPAEHRDSVDDLASDTCSFLVDELGGYKTYSIDSQDTIARRAQWVRDM